MIHARREMPPWRDDEWSLCRLKTADLSDDLQRVTCPRCAAQYDRDLDHGVRTWVRDPIGVVVHGGLGTGMDRDLHALAKLVEMFPAEWEVIRWETERRSQAKRKAL